MRTWTRDVVFKETPQTAQVLGISLPEGSFTRGSSRKKMRARVITGRPVPRTGRIERRYAQQLRQLARNVGRLLESLEESGAVRITEVLQHYADALVPWARRTAESMIRDVNARERDAWRALGTDISVQMHRELREAPIGRRVDQLLETQVALITSIPRKAAERVHELALESVANGTRAKSLSEEILRTNRVTESRALLIARTEVGRASTVLTQARCESVGATHYLWRTAGDHDVRPGHAAMEGKVCEWANPPAVEENGKIMHFHPGTIWNCRCYAEPVLDDPYAPKPRNLHLVR